MNDISVKLAKAIILFLRGGPWTPADHAEWQALTGTQLATTKTLADLARKVLTKEETTKHD